MTDVSRWHLKNDLHLVVRPIKYQVEFMWRCVKHLMKTCWNHTVLAFSLYTALRTWPSPQWVRSDCDHRALCTCIIMTSGRWNKTFPPTQPYWGRSQGFSLFSHVFSKRCLTWLTQRSHRGHAERFECHVEWERESVKTIQKYSGFTIHAKEAPRSRRAIRFPSAPAPLDPLYSPYVAL